MNELRNLAIKAHGGFKRWSELSTATANLKATGALLQLKGQANMLRDIKIEMNLHQESVVHYSFLSAEQFASFTPDRVAIETLGGTVVQEISHPRASFKGHSSDTKWDYLQLAYFSGCCLWTSFTAPFIFVEPGFKTTELSPFLEERQVWRRLEVIYPEGIATHSRRQIFYFNNEGLLKRHDFDLEISAEVSLTQYYDDYKDFDGIMVPTKRTVLVRSPDGSILPEPLVAQFELDNVKFA